MADDVAPLRGYAVPLSYLHLRPTIEARLVRSGIETVGQLVDGWTRKEDAVHALSRPNAAHVSEAVGILAQCAGGDALPDWEGYWALRAIHLIPNLDRSLSPAELLGELPALFLEILIAENASSATGERAWAIVSHRNGLDGQSYTLDKIGGALQLTRERVRQIQKQAAITLEESSQRGFAGPHHRLRPMAAESVETLLAAGPTAPEPVIREDELFRRLGLAPELSGAHRNRLRFLLGLRAISVVDVDQATGTLWTTGDEQAGRLVGAIPKIRAALADVLVEGATELEVSIATRGSRKPPVDRATVAAALRLMGGIEWLPDGRVRSSLGQLGSTQHQAYRLLADAGATLVLDDMLRAVNAVRPRARPLSRGSFSNMLSSDPRFVPLGHTGVWGLADRDNREAVPMWERIVDSLRRLATPSLPQAIAEAMDPPASDRTLIITYLHQLRPTHVVQLKDGRWVLAEWREARNRATVKVHRKVDLGITPSQAAVDAELTRMLGAAPGRELSIGDAVDGIVRALGRTWPSAYYYVGRSSVVDSVGSESGRRVRLRQPSGSADA